jgi:uncharacterized membrane protein (DUF2068 family)
VERAGRPEATRELPLHAPRPLGLRVIALFKLSSSVVLFAVALGAFQLMHTAGVAQLAHWINILQADPDEHILLGLLVQLSLVAPRTLQAVSVGTLVYAALLLTEGVGLWLRQRWAEYFTVIVTASFIPLELYEVVRHLSGVNLAVLASNVAIVAYLLTRLAWAWRTLT